jgi:hypothetical protein
VLSISGRLSRTGAILAAAVIAGGLGYLYRTTPPPAMPRRPLRIGFEHNPPVQIRGDTGFTGLAVDTVKEAAKRAGIALRIGGDRHQFGRSVQKRAGGSLATDGRRGRSPETRAHHGLMAAQQSRHDSARRRQRTGAGVYRLHRVVQDAAPRSPPPGTVSLSACGRNPGRLNACPTCAANC